MLKNSTISRFAYERNIFAAHLRASLELRKSVISVFIRNAKMEEMSEEMKKRTAVKLIHALRLILVLTRISTLQKFPIDVAIDFSAIFAIDRVFVRVLDNAFKNSALVWIFW